MGKVQAFMRNRRPVKSCIVWQAIRRFALCEAGSAVILPNKELV